MQRASLIAVVNDDPAFLEFIACFLEEETPYRTVVWDDGAGSLPKLRKHRPDLVILDVRLGDQVEGYEILKGMRADRELKHTPVIICTADVGFLKTHRDLIAALEAEVFEKPFDIQ